MNASLSSFDYRVNPRRKLQRAMVLGIEYMDVPLYWLLWVCLSSHCFASPSFAGKIAILLDSRGGFPITKINVHDVEKPPPVVFGHRSPNEVGGIFYPLLYFGGTPGERLDIRHAWLVCLAMFFHSGSTCIHLLHDMQHFLFCHQIKVCGSIYKIHGKRLASCVSSTVPRRWPMKLLDVWTLSSTRCPLHGLNETHLVVIKTFTATMKNQHVLNFEVILWCYSPFFTLWSWCPSRFWSSISSFRCLIFHGPHVTGLTLGEICAKVFHIRSLPDPTEVSIEMGPGLRVTFW